MTERSLEDYTPAELVDEARKLRESNRLFNTILSDSETRGDALKLLKKTNPKMPIPEIDAKVEAEKLVAAEREAREKSDQRIRTLEIRESLREEEARLKKEYDFTDADVIEVKKLMVDEKAPIANFDGAAKVYKASRQQAVPTSASLSPRTYDMPGKEKWGGGVGNKMALNKIFTEEAYAAVNAVRTGKAA